MNAPKAYNEWNNVLKLLAKRTNDKEVLDMMMKGTLQIQSGVYERFIKKLIDVINQRLNDVIDRFSKEMTYAKGQESLIIKALIGLRKEIEFLIKVVSIPAIPAKDATTYIDFIKKQANIIQESLEKSAKNNDQSGRLLFVVQNNKINNF